jgi:hypothetical protein
MSKFIPTKRTPCPVCRDESGKCRLADELVLCMGSPNGEIDGLDYSFIRPSGGQSSGLWGVYAPRKDEPESDRQERLDEITRQRQKRLAELAQQHENGLTIPERDRHTRTLSSTIGLTTAHRQNLINRGLNDDQIKYGCFFSVDTHHPIPPSVSDKLPGVGYAGDRKVLLNKGSGFACPAFNLQGEILGWQVRYDDPGDRGKYRYPCSAFSAHLQNGELPITTFGNDSSAWLTEGFLKPYVAHCRLGVRVIGAPGGNFGGSPLLFRTYLKGVKEVLLCPDAGDILNYHTFNRWEKIAQSIPKFVKPWLVWWGQFTKEENDLDSRADMTGMGVHKVIAWRSLAKGITFQKFDQKYIVRHQDKIIGEAPLTIDKMQFIRDFQV